MAKYLNAISDEQLKKKSKIFIKNVNSDIKFSSNFTGDSLSFDWLKEIEFACSYIDNIVRAPRVALVSEENVVKIEKAKKITVASVKDLSRHTQFIEKIDKKTEDVQPSKILDVRNEETFNTYENRFVFTLVNDLMRFIAKREIMLEEFEANNKKTLEYEASTTTGNENINIQLKITSKETLENKSDNSFQNEIELVKIRIKKIKQFINSWGKSEFIKNLEKSHVAFVTPPIKKTNLILKNPNFQIAMRLWEFLRVYDLKINNESSGEDIKSLENNSLKDIMDESFLSNYIVMDSISSSKKQQKEKLARYALIMINQQVQRAIALLLNSGVKISDEEILSMIAEEIKNERNKKLVGSTDIKKKFKSAMDEYLERTQNYL